LYLKGDKFRYSFFKLELFLLLLLGLDVHFTEGGVVLVIEEHDLKVGSKLAIKSVTSKTFINRLLRVLESNA
jgi:hypothetical protein